MEFIYKNLFNTTTQATIESGTATISNVFSRDLTRQYVTDGYDNDLTTTSITIAFGETTTISRIAMLGTNLKDFTLFYNGATANTFAMTTTSATTTTDFSSNSETSMYMKVTSVDVTSVSIDMLSTQTANAEKAIGFFVLSDLLLDFERIPSSKNYKPLVKSKEIVHKLSNGAIRVNVLARTMGADIKFKHITTAFRDSLLTVYNLRDEFMFAAFPTTTAFDQVFFPCAWSGNFDFFRYSDDAASAGFGGKINLDEVPS